jgi:NAD(P)H-dependent FMN reductase
MITSQTLPAASGKSRLITLWTLSGLVALTFIAAAGGKLAGAANMVELFDKVGLGQWFRYFTGLLEMVGAIGLLVSRYAFYAAVLLAVTMVGAIVAHVTRWILQHLKKREGIEARLLDLRDFPMPFFDQPLTPAMPGRPPYENDVVKRWTAEIAASDGFIFVTPEYNYGPSAVLKNAIDWVYSEWNRKAAAFVSYGSAMGARSVQQLRETMIEIQIAPVRSSVHIPVATLWAHYKSGDVEKGLAEVDGQAQTMIDDLLWWTTALKTAKTGR